MRARGHVGVGDELTRVRQRDDERRRKSVRARDVGVTRQKRILIPTTAPESHPSRVKRHTGNDDDIERADVRDVAHDI